jgi:hypothetical protein
MRTASMVPYRGRVALIAGLLRCAGTVRADHGHGQAPAVVAFNGGEDVFATGLDNQLWFGSVSPTGTT